MTFGFWNRSRVTSRVTGIFLRNCHGYVFLSRVCPKKEKSWEYWEFENENCPKIKHCKISKSNFRHGLLVVSRALFSKIVTGMWKNVTGKKINTGFLWFLRLPYRGHFAVAVAVAFTVAVAVGKNDCIPGSDLDLQIHQ